jgi:hypothetical protein
VHFSRHRGVGIGDADLLIPAGLPAFFFGAVLAGRRLVLPGQRVHVPRGKAFPTHIGSDQRSVDVHHLPGCDLASMQACTVRSKIRRNHSAPQRWRMHVGEE